MTRGGTAGPAIVRYGCFLTFMLAAPFVAAASLELYVALDITGSFAEDQEAAQAQVTKILSGLTEGSCVEVVAITESEPLILLARDCVPRCDRLADEEKIRAARNKVLKRWQESKLRTELNTSGRNESDVFAVLWHISQRLPATPERQQIVILLSDLRNTARGINLEKPARIDVGRVLADVRKEKAIFPFRGVRVIAEGVHNRPFKKQPKSFAYAESLRQFWTSYFQDTGATGIEFYSGFGKATETLGSMPRPPGAVCRNQN